MKETKFSDFYEKYMNVDKMRKSSSLAKESYSDERENMGEGEMNKNRGKTCPVKPTKKVLKLKYKEGEKLMEDETQDIRTKVQEQFADLFEFMADEITKKVVAIMSGEEDEDDDDDEDEDDMEDVKMEVDMDVEEDDEDEGDMEDVEEEEEEEEEEE